MKNRISLLLSLFALLIASCASTPNSPQSSEMACESADGVWTDFKSLYPENYLNGDDLHRHICRIRTHEEAVICTDNSQCKGLCIPEKEVDPGAAATGFCAQYTWPSYSEQEKNIINGKVSHPTISTEDTDEKAGMLKTLQANKTKWVQFEAKQYHFKARNENCYCLFGPYYGPVEVFVNNEQVQNVIYRGEKRDGYQAGDRVKIDTQLKFTIDELFYRVENLIKNATENTLLTLEYDPVFGFPSLIDYDRTDWEDNQSRMVISDFVLVE